MKPEVNRATAMLFRAGVKHIKAVDAEILGADIKRLAGELAGETGDPAFFVADAARELEARIGGLKNLEPYMRCLRGESLPRKQA